MKLSLSVFVVSLMVTSAAMAADAEFHASTYTTYKKHSPYAGSVKVLDRTPDIGQYIEIGLVRIGTDKVYSYYDALDELKEAAAKHGGTAIVLEDDAKIFSEGGTTDRGTRPLNATATAVILSQ